MDKAKLGLKYKVSKAELLALRMQYDGPVTHIKHKPKVRSYVELQPRDYAEPQDTKERRNVKRRRQRAEQARNGERADVRNLNDTLEQAGVSGQRWGRVFGECRGLVI
jgi:hypothetical protein